MLVTTSQLNNRIVSIANDSLKEPINPDFNKNSVNLPVASCLDSATHALNNYLLHAVKHESHNFVSLMVQ